MGVLRSLPLVKYGFKIWASAKGASYRSEAELTEEVSTRLPEVTNLQTIKNIEVQVRSKASPPWLSEFYSRQVLASVNVELVDDAPPYNIVTLQQQLRKTEIPIVQIFSQSSIKKGDLGINEYLLYNPHDESSLVILLELGSNIGKIEQWVHDLDTNMLSHLQEVEIETPEEFNSKEYDHGDRIKTSITAHLSRSSRKIELDRRLSKAEKIRNVTVFRRCEPDWYIKRIAGSDRTNETIISVSHRVRLDNDRDGFSTKERVFENSGASIQWLDNFIDDPPEKFDLSDPY